MADAATVNIVGSAVGTSLTNLLMADEIVPGSEASYQTCKTIYLYHPLGGKIVDGPIEMAFSQPRDISIPDAPEEQVRDQFVRVWRRLRANTHIASAMRMARIYGISTLVVGTTDQRPEEPLDLRRLTEDTIFFNALDPLNTAGSLVLSQDPNSPNFQAAQSVTVSGTTYHPSRCCVMMNETPIYIAYTTSAFGFVGRSAYQRALYPLKSFVQTMRTDDMVTRKAGVLVAKMEAPGSIVDGLMTAIAGQKRELLKAAENDNVLGINPKEDVSSLNLQNLEGPAALARKNVLENIATAVPMPAILLNQETFAEGFGEGTEDAKAVVRFVDGFREQMAPLFVLMDRIVQHVAWSPAFYETIRAQFPAEYGDVDYESAFYRWQNSFEATWPSLMVEPESEKVKVDQTKLEAVTGLLEVLLPISDPDNKARLLRWAADNFNQNKNLFGTPLELDWEDIARYEPAPPPTPDDQSAQPKIPAPPRPESL